MELQLSFMLFAFLYGMPKFHWIIFPVFCWMCLKYSILQFNSILFAVDESFMIISVVQGEFIAGFHL